MMSKIDSTTATQQWSRPLVVCVKQALLLISASLFTPLIYAGPDGGVITGGAGSITYSGTHSGNNTTIQQTSQNMAIEWNSYNLNSSERVQYIQPNQSSISLNHILSNSASTIRGRIDANGQVILVNPNGIVFTPESVINVGGIIASSLDIKTGDFMNGHYLFNEFENRTGNADSDGIVINRGTINAALGGNVALLGKRVDNSGLIAAKLGSITLAAGKQATLSFDSAGLLGVNISEAVLQNTLGVDPSVLNSGTLQAEAGQVLLTGSVSHNLFTQAVNNGAMQQARSVVANSDGSFTLGDGADVINSGLIDVSTTQATQTTQIQTPNHSGRITLLGENITSSGILTADTHSGNGGEIELHAKNTTRLTNDSITRARAEHAGTGGTIKILGNRVALFDNSRIDASGDLGGGTVLIGGDYQGSNSAIRNAQRAYVAKGSTLSASALSRGDGGRIITWSDDYTWFYGHAEVNAGNMGGDGGLIEISGKGLAFDGHVSARAPLGKAGTVLFDPLDIVIYDATTLPLPTPNNNIELSNSDGEILYGESPGEIFYISHTTLQGVDSDVNIELQATNDITINDLASNELTLKTGSNNSITITANADNSGAGSFSMNSGDTIKTSGGAVIIRGVNVTVGNVNTTFDRRAGGSVTLTATGTGTGMGVPNGTLTVGDIDTQGKTNDSNGLSGGAVTLEGYDITIGSINSSGGNAGGSNNKSGGNAGAVMVTAANNITLNSPVGLLPSGIKANGGAGPSDNNADNSRNGNGGAGAGITLTAGNTLQVNANIESKGGEATRDVSTGSNGSGGAGGDVLLNSNTVVVNAAIDSSGGNGRGTNTTGNYIARGGAAGEVKFDNMNTLTLAANIKAVGGSGNTIGGSNNIVFHGTAGNDQFTIADTVLLQGLAATLKGLGGVDTLSVTGSNANSWNITGPKAGNVKFNNAPNQLLLSFVDMATLNGSAGVDTFTITGNFAGGINGFGGGDVFNLSSSVAGALNGGADNDAFNLKATGLSIANIIGGDGEDTLTGANESTPVVWTISGTDSGALAVNNNTVSFSGIDTLMGGTGVDRFDITNDFAGLINGALGHDVFNVSSSLTSGKLEGGAGNDEFNLKVTGLSINRIVGGDGVDTLRGANEKAVWSINQIDGGLLKTTTNGQVWFENVEHLTGGTDDDTFTMEPNGKITGSIDGGTGLGLNSVNGREDIANIWSINGAGSITDGASTTYLNSFTNIQRLNGGALADTFNLTTTFAGAIDGGAGDDLFNVAESDNGQLSLYGGVGADRFVFVASGASVALIDGGEGEDSLQAFKNSNGNTWSLGPVSNILNGGTTFVGVESLLGGETKDTFNISGNFAGTLNGGAGDDEFVLKVSGLSVTSINGGLGTDTLLGANEDSSWSVASENAGGLNTTNAGVVTFVGIENLKGGAGDDRFVFTTLGSRLTGWLDGAGHGVEGDRIDLTAAGDSNVVIRQGNPTAVDQGFFNVEHMTANGTSALTGNSVNNDWTITGANAGTVGGLTFVGFNKLVGGSGQDIFNLHDTLNFAGSIDGAGGSDTLVGGNRTNGWTISGLGSGAVTGLMSGFANIENLTGSAGDDSFVFTSTSANITGLINGMGEFTKDSVDLTNAGNKSIVIGQGLLNVERITANGTSTLTGKNEVNDWLITGANAGTVGGLTFAGFNKLVGGSGQDSFTLHDTLDFAGSIDGAGGSDTLVGGNRTNGWTISGLGSGAVTGLGGGFTNIENLAGNAGDDSFVFTSTGANITGLVNGMGELTKDSVDLTNAGNKSIVIGQGLLNVERITANGTSNLTGSNVNNDWTITSANAGTVGGLTFAGFNSLIGGDGQDTFRLHNTIDFAGSITGGAGSDVVVGGNRFNTWRITAINGGSVTGLRDGFSGIETLLGNGGQDIFNLHDSLSFAGSIDGAGGSDTLVGGNRSNSWTISGLDSGVVTGLGAGFTNVENLTGNAGDDSFEFTSANANITGLINGMGESTKDSINLRALGDVAVVIGQRFLNMERMIANGSSTLTANNVNNDWQISGAKSGKVGTVEFEGFTQLVGGAAEDTFTLGSVDFKGSIDGAGGSDALVGSNRENIWNIDGVNMGRVIGLDGGFSGIENLTGGANNDSFVFTSLAANITGVVDGAGHSTQDSVDLSVAGDRSIIVDQSFLNIERITANGSSTLTGNNGANSWQITAANAGTVGGLTFAGFNKLVGGSGQDSFKLHDVLDFAGSIAGGAGSDSLMGGNRNNLWSITAANGGSVTGLSGGFTGIETLLGNGGQDVFNLHDTLDFAGSIDGAGGSDTLVGGNRSNDWILSGLGSGAVTGLMSGFANIENLTGNAGDDRFVFASTSANIAGLINGMGELTKDSVDLTNAGSKSIVIGQGLLNVESILANGSSTLTGNNVNNDWTITSANTGTVGGLTFAGFNKLVGGDGQDVFNLHDTVEFAGSIVGGAGSDTLMGGNRNNLWSITAANGGSVTGLSGGFTGIEAVVGNAGQDRFDLHDNFNFAGTLDGAGGLNDTLVGGNRVNSWSITGVDSGSVTGLTQGFVGIERLVGNANQDIFGLHDTINFVGSIDGAAGSDTVIAGNRKNSWNITGSDSGSVIGVATGFTGMELLVGGGDEDIFQLANTGGFVGSLEGAGGINTLIAGNRSNSWSVTGGDSGSVTGIGAGYRQIQNLTGGNSDDLFTLEATGTVSGSLDGGLGSNVLNARVGIDNVWTIATTGNRVNEVNLFRNINTLNGGAKVDTFNIATGFGGVMNGMDGDDIFNISSSMTGVLNGGLGTDQFNLNVLGVSVAGINGDAGMDVLRGANENVVWNLVTASSGNLANGRVNFTGIGQYVGGSGDDQFSLANGVDLSSLLIDGGGHVAGDSVDLANVNGALRVVLGGAGIANIETIVGNNHSDTLLVGENNLNNWLIVGPGAGVIDQGTAEQLTFSGMTNLLGGTADDNFRFKSANGENVAFPGSIHGGDGAGSDKIDYSNQDNVTVTVSSALEAISGSSINGIEGVIGGVNSTLKGADANSNWTIDGSNKGTVRYRVSNGNNSQLTTLDFEGFANLLGGTADDTFLFSSGAAMSGWIDGGSGAAFDSVDMAALSQVNVLLGGNLRNIEQVTGNNIASTLTGANTNNSWTLTGENDGSVNGVTFINFNNLVGGSADDHFKFNAQGRLLGRVDGGASTTRDSIDMASRASVDVVLGRDVVNVEKITGNSVASTLTGENNANSWIISGLNGGSVDGVEFVGFNNLVGGSADDHFVFTAQGRMTGKVDGGAHVAQDSVNMSALATVGVVLGQDVVNIEQITGNDINTTLTGGNNNSRWSVTARNGGAVNGVAFTNVNNLVGGNADDEFVFTGQGRLTGRIDGGEHLTQDSIDMAGLSVASVVLGKDAVNVEQIIGNNNASTLAAENKDNIWTLTGENDGNVAGVAFTNFNNLVGGSGDDRFDFNFGSSLTGRIDGGGHVTGDSVSMAALSTVNVVLGKDLLNIEQVMGNSSASTLIGENRVNTWTLTGENRGAVNGVTFTNFNNLVGGNADDVFTFNTLGRITGSIDGGLHLIQDSINMASLATVNLVLGSNLFNVEQITGNNTNSTLTAENSANLWTLTGENDGDVNGVRFVDFNFLTGGSGDDRFVFNAGGRLAGVIDGGDHIIQDAVDMSAMADVDLRLGVNVVNIESATGNGNSSRLTAVLDRANSWSVTGANSGKVNEVTFAGFNHLLGGRLDDNFLFSRGGSISGSIDGGAQVNQDSVDMTALERVDVVLGKQIINIEKIFGNNSASTLTATDTTNLWSIDALNSGRLSGNEQVLLFSGFNHLVGGKARDQFDIAGQGVLDGTIFGGEGDDVLSVALSGAQSGRVSFNGGAGSDSVKFSGSQSYIESYLANESDGEFVFANGGKEYAVALSNVASIRDDVLASLTVYGTAANDAMVLDTGLFAVNSATPVYYANKNSIAFDGAAGDADRITVQGSINATNSISLIAEAVSSAPAAVITAERLILNSVNAVGTASQRLRTDVKNLQLINGGGIYLDNAANLTIADMRATDVVDIAASGDVSSSVVLMSDYALSIAASGNIDLSNSGNQLRGPVGLKAETGNITLKNGVDTHLVYVDAKNLTVDGVGNIISAGEINLTGDSKLSATKEITITGSNDFTKVELFANNIVLHDKNGIDVNNVVATGNVIINAGAGIGVGSIAASQLTLDAGTGQVSDKNGAAMNMIADKIVLRANTGITAETQAATLDVINQTGTVDINNRGNVLLTNLVTQGSIKFDNDLNVTVDRLDAGYSNVDGNVDINITNGSLFGLTSTTGPSRDYRSTPEITANSVNLKVSQDIGTRGRPVSVYINNEFALFSNVGSVYYYGRRPKVVIDSSKIKVSVFDALVGLSGQQLITVETLAEIDPAIFTDVKNFNQGDISVMLPPDQLYGDSGDKDDGETEGQY